MIRGLHHVACNTPNFDRMLEFYTALGFEAAGKGGGVKNNASVEEIVGLENVAFRAVMLRAGNTYIELFEYSSPAAREGEPLRPCDHGYTHICLDAIDIDEEWERLAKLGVAFRRGPVDLGWLKTIYGKDPDGNVIELQEIMSPENEIALEKLKLFRSNITG